MKFFSLLLLVLATSATAQTTECVKSIRARYSQSFQAMKQQKEDEVLNRNVHTEINRMEAAVGIVNYKVDYYDLKAQQADNFLRITRTPSQNFGSEYVEVLYDALGPIFYFEKNSLYQEEGDDRTEIRIYWESYGWLDTFTAQTIAKDGTKRNKQMSEEERLVYAAKARAYAKREQRKYAQLAAEGRYPDVVAPYVDSDNPVDDFRTPDLTFFSLKGHVKSVRNGAIETCFDMEGNLVTVNGQSTNRQASRIYIPKTGDMFEYVGYGRNEEGLITSMNMFEGEETYAWKDGHVVSDRGGEAGTEWSNTYLYNADGWIETLKTRSWSFDEEEKAAPVVTTRYKYIEFDGVGNWIARLVHTSENTYAEYRTIDYYPEFLSE